MERPTRAKIESLAADVVILQGDNETLRSRVARLEEALKEISEMKIPYCDAYDVAHGMRDTAQSALEEK